MPGVNWNEPLAFQLLLPLDLLSCLIPAGNVAPKGDFGRQEQDPAWISLCSPLKIPGILMDEVKAGFKCRGGSHLQNSLLITGKLRIDLCMETEGFIQHPAFFGSQREKQVWIREFQEI